MAFHIDPKSKKQRWAAAGIVGFFAFVASQLGGVDPVQQFQDDVLAELGADAITVYIAHNATTTVWTDVSGFNNHVTAPTLANEPQVFSSGYGSNSRAYVEFNPAGPDYYRLATGCANFAADQSGPGFMAVFSTSAAGTTRTIADYSCTSGASACVFKPRITSTNRGRVQGIATGEVTDLECDTSTSVDNNINTLNLYEGWFSLTSGSFHARLNGAGECTIAVANVGGLVRNREACVQLNFGHRMALTAGNQFQGRVAFAVAAKNFETHRAAIIALAEPFFGADWTP